MSSTRSLRAEVRAGQAFSLPLSVLLDATRFAPALVRASLALHLLLAGPSTPTLVQAGLPQLRFAVLLSGIGVYFLGA